MSHHLENPAPAEYGRANTEIRPAWGGKAPAGTVGQVQPAGLAYSRGRRVTSGAQTPPRPQSDAGVLEFTPRLRAALVVARVHAADVSPSAPRSSLEALVAGPLLRTGRRRPSCASWQPRT